LGVTTQVLHDTLGLRVIRVAKIRDETVMTCQPDVFGSGDDHVGDHTRAGTPPMALNASAINASVVDAS
jgi:hypothetical protein